MALTKRADFRFQVACVIADRVGPFAWGWAHSVEQGYRGEGSKSQHAEMHALTRANKDRLPGAVAYIAAIKRKNGTVVRALPRYACWIKLRHSGLSKIEFSSGVGTQWDFLRC